MIEDYFVAWYREYNPELDMSKDDSLDELRHCFYTAWSKALETEHALNVLSDFTEE